MNLLSNANARVVSLRNWACACWISDTLPEISPFVLGVCMKNCECGRTNLRPLVPAAHINADMPLVKPILMVRTGVVRWVSTSSTASDGLRLPPGLLKYSEISSSESTL